MAEHIHTIPVLDALRDPQGCAFCTMQKKLENDVIQFIMGPAYMEDDVRMQTNKVGFCKSHLNAMYEAQNRLGLALMLHTHVQELCTRTSTIISGRMPTTLFGKDPSGMLSRLRGHVAKVGESCYVCTRAGETFERYVSTFFYIWNRGGDDARLIQCQKGYCLPHFNMLFTAVEKFGRGKREKYLDVLLPTFEATLSELEKDLDWFVQKFDHRNANEPWKNSKDALPRAMGFLEGYK